ncbi:MAG: hypothetical protein ACYS22_13470 [Planctomycetota bacterium]
MNNLARFMPPAEAKRLLERTLDAGAQALGADHPALANSRSAP